MISEAAAGAFAELCTVYASDASERWRPNLKLGMIKTRLSKKSTCPQTHLTRHAMYQKQLMQIKMVAHNSA